MSGKLQWHTEQRKVSDLIPFEENPRKMSKSQAQDLQKSIERFGLVEIPAIDTLGRKRILKRCRKICPICNKEFLVFWHLRNKRKFCSQECSGINNTKNLIGYMGGEFIIKLNKSKDHIEKVRIGLKKHYKNNPRTKEKWYIEKYGENYIPKKLKHISRWKMQSKELRERNKCHRCGSNKYLDVHHIIPFAISKDNSIGNLIVLCRRCHKIVEDNNWKIFNLFNDWEIVRSCFRNKFLDVGKPIYYEEFGNTAN